MILMAAAWPNGFEAKNTFPRPPAPRASLNVQSPIVLLLGWGAGMSASIHFPVDSSLLATMAIRKVPSRSSTGLLLLYHPCTTWYMAGKASRPPASSRLGRTLVAAFWAGGYIGSALHTRSRGIRSRSSACPVVSGRRAAGMTEWSHIRQEVSSSPSCSLRLCVESRWRSNWMLCQSNFMNIPIRHSAGVLLFCCVLVSGENLVSCAVAAQKSIIQDLYCDLIRNLNDNSVKAATYPSAKMNLEPSYSSDRWNRGTGRRSRQVRYRSFFRVLRKK